MGRDHYYPSVKKKLSYGKKRKNSRYKGTVKHFPIMSTKTSRRHSNYRNSASRRRAGRRYV